MTLSAFHGRLQKRRARELLRQDCLWSKRMRLKTIIAEKEGPDLDFTGEELDVCLEPRTEYIVRVCVTGDAGDSACSESVFETGKMTEAWQAEWIAPDADDDCHPFMKKSFTVKPGLSRARLYATGVGLFEAYINGEKLGDEYLLPGVTDYEKRIQVITFPVSGLREGENELGFLLGKGWFMGTFGLEMKDKYYGSRQICKEAILTEHLTCSSMDSVQ